MILYRHPQHRHPAITFRGIGLILILCGLITPLMAQDPGGQVHPPEQIKTDSIQDTSIELDQNVCWFEKPFVTLYKAAIANPQAQADFSLPGLEEDSFLSLDGHTIRGLVWRAEKPRGYLLISLGTSMLAEEVYPAFSGLRDLDLDIFIYNYRGFKHSEGETTLTGILSDMVRAATRLNNDPRYQYRFFYGLSFGGIVFSSMLNRHALPYDGVILDSVPDHIPFVLFCPGRFDPVNNLPESCPQWQAIAGGHDSVIGKSGVHLAAAIEQCGGSAIINHHFGHIFMDGKQHTMDRLAILKNSLRNHMQEKNTPPSKE